MDQAKYQEAIKVIQAKKPKENYLLIQISYDTKIVLPYKDGLTFMASLAVAEQLTEHYEKPTRITGFVRETITTRVLSFQEYERYKIAALLNVAPGDIEEFE